MDFVKFWACANEISGKIGASLEDEGAESYVKGLYDDYIREQKVNTEKPKDWLRKALENSFVSMDTPPKWIGEPFWAFLDGIPMAFLHQFTISTKAQHLKLSLGYTVYVFGGRKICGNGEKSSAYKLIVIDDDGMRLHAKMVDHLIF